MYAPAAGSAILGYEVFVGTTSGQESTRPLNLTLFKTTSDLVKGLKRGVTYYFIVRAVHAKGLGPASNEISLVV